MSAAHERDTTAETRTAAIPARQRATDASLRNRLAAALERNRQLAENSLWVPTARSQPLTWSLSIGRGRSS